MRRDVFNLFRSTFGEQAFGFFVLVHGIHMTYKEIEQARSDYEKYLMTYKEIEQARSDYEKYLKEED